MAESFFTIIDRGTFTVSHRGEEVTLELPEELRELAGKLEDQKALEQWMFDNDCFMALAHSAIQKRLIELRALARPAEEVSILTDKAGAQKRVSESIWKPAKRPGTKTKKQLTEAEILEQMKGLGLNAAAAKAMIEKLGE